MKHPVELEEQNGEERQTPDLMRNPFSGLLQTRNLAFQRECNIFFVKDCSQYYLLLLYVLAAQADSHATFNINPPPYESQLPSQTWHKPHR